MGIPLLKYGVHYPYYVATGLMNSVGQKLVEVTSSDEQKICCLAHRSSHGTTLWVANLTGETQKVAIKAAERTIVGNMLDETSFKTATSKPLAFQASWKPMGANLTLKPYAIAILSLAG